MQSVETAGIARGTTDFPHVFLDELRYVRGTLAQRRQPALVNFFIAYTFSSFFRSSFLAAGQMIEGRNQALQLQKVVMRSA